MRTEGHQTLKERIRRRVVLKLKIPVKDRKKNSQKNGFQAMDYAILKNLFEDAWIQECK